MEIGMSCHIDPIQLPVAFKLNGFEHIDLGAELDALSRIAPLQLPDAVAFYAGRIVEATSNDLIARLGLRVPESTFANLDVLASSGRCDDGWVACGNVLRRIGNHARHMDRPVHASEQATILALLQIWLESWAALASPGRGVAAVTAVDWSDVTPLVRRVVSGSPHELEGLFDADGRCSPRFTDEPALASFVGERLVDANLSVAQSYTANLLRIFPKDKRAHQVRALYLSRNARATEAAAVLERLLRWRYGSDRETLGILGGAYKNIWLDGGSHEFLQRAHAQYARNPADGEPGYYLLINAAATALWLGDSALARAQAYAAEQHLLNYGVDEALALSSAQGFWLTATLAEARLLQGKTKSATKLYAHARDVDRSGGRWQRTRRQLAVHLRHLDLPQGADGSPGGLIELVGGANQELAPTSSPPTATP